MYVCLRPVLMLAWAVFQQPQDDKPRRCALSVVACRKRQTMGFSPRKVEGPYARVLGAPRCAANSVFSLRPRSAFRERLRGPIHEGSVGFSGTRRRTGDASTRTLKEGGCYRPRDAIGITCDRCG